MSLTGAWEPLAYGCGIVHCEKLLEGFSLIVVKVSPPKYSVFLVLQTLLVKMLERMYECRDIRNDI